jgi:glutamyl-tRNA reductase
MSLIVVGLNHNSAPVNIREKINFSEAQLERAYGELLKISQIKSVLIISTCNRTEIYANSNLDGIDIIIRKLYEFHNLSAHQIVPYLFSYQNNEAINHLFGVCCGLDSLILGEPQILGQVKSAFKTACQYSAIDSYFYKLFECSFATAKLVRTKTAIGANPVSVAFAAVSLAKQIFGELGQYTALMIGAGETIELAISHLKKNKIKNIIIANRTYEKAQKLAKTCDAKAIIIKNIPEFLPQADIIISSTASQLPLLGKGAVESALKARKHKPMFMVDIAVPRDIEEQVEELDDVFLYTVDDLQDIITENQKSRQTAAIEAQKYLSLAVDDFLTTEKSLSSIDTIKNMRTNINNITDEVMAKNSQKMDEKQKKILQQFSRNLVNKIMHQPTISLKQAAIDDNQDLIQAVNKIFNLT